MQDRAWNEVSQPWLHIRIYVESFPKIIMLNPQLLLPFLPRNLDSMGQLMHVNTLIYLENSQVMLKCSQGCDWDRILSRYRTKSVLATLLLVEEGFGKVCSLMSRLLSKGQIYPRHQTLGRRWLLPDLHTHLNGTLNVLPVMSIQVWFKMNRLC